MVSIYLICLLIFFNNYLLLLSLWLLINNVNKALELHRIPQTLKPKYFAFISESSSLSFSLYPVLIQQFLTLEFSFLHQRICVSIYMS